MVGYKTANYTLHTTRYTLKIDVDDIDDVHNLFMIHNIVLEEITTIKPTSSI